MTNPNSLHYTQIEIESYLPTGWNLSEQVGAGEWDTKTRSWKTTVIDGADFEWPLVVKGEEAASRGRMPALQAAMDRVFRDRLGKPTRGLGLG